MHFAALSDEAATSLEQGSVHLTGSMTPAKFLIVQSCEGWKNEWSFLESLHPDTFMPSTHSFWSHLVLEQTNWSGAARSPSYTLYVEHQHSGFHWARDLHVPCSSSLCPSISIFGQTCLLVLQRSKNSMYYCFCGSSIEPSVPTIKKLSSFVPLLAFEWVMALMLRAGRCHVLRSISREVKLCNWCPPWIFSSWKTIGTILKF